jgi:hypothetical protein
MVPRLILLVSLALASPALAQQEKHQEQPAQQREESQSPTPIPDQASADNRPSHAKNEDSQIDRYFEFIERHGEFALVAVTLALAVATGFLWWATRALVKGSERTARIDQRAWVGVTGIEGRPNLNQKLIVTTKAINTGKSFAINFRSVVYFQMVPADGKPDFSLDELRPYADASKTLLAPGGGEYVTESDVFCEYETKTVTQTQLNDWKEGKSLFIVAGKLTYEDIFGYPHWTTFCFRMRRDLKGYNTYKDHNDTDPLPPN